MSHLPNRSSTAALLAALFFIAARPAASEAVDYEKDVKPILRERCYACHGALKQESDLRLDTAALARKGGASGAAIEAGDPDASLLLYRVLAEDQGERMPPEGNPLTAAQIRAIRQWIAAGAEGPEGEQPEADPRLHWAFQRPQRPPVPVAGSPVNNAIDAFIAALREEHELQSVGAIDRPLLLRRLYLDLVGLPPSPRELREFAADTRPDAVERVVERLLASPHYGERWGRHWMDVWRYSDWYGLGQQLRYSQKHIWHWRDWIVESLNRDKGYDRMLTEMLAADEIAPTDRDQLRATGFLARNYWIFNRTTWLDDTIEHTSKAFLGLTMNCTKCHDHKYDPISQEDYYRLRAIFEPHQVRLDPVPGETDLERDGLPRVFDAHPDEPTYLHVRGDDRQPDKSRVLEPGVPAVLEFRPLQVAAVDLPPTAHRPALQDFVLEDHLRAARQEISRAEQQLDEARAKLEEVEQAERRAAALAADRSNDGQTAEQPAASDTSDEPLWQDDFSEARPDLWETGPGEWTFDDGRLKQSRAIAERSWLRSRGEHPRDFAATFVFRPLGGPKYRSVGLCFDVVDEREKLVYLSAVSPGSKLQISYRTAANHVYPPAGKQDRPVELGRAYRLEIAVRDRLVNVSLDGEHALAFALPIAREAGRLSLITFDAEAEFEHFELRALPADRPLVTPPSGETPPAAALTREQAEAAVAVAEARLAASLKRPALLAAAHLADRAKLIAAESADKQEKIAAAARATREYELAVAEQALAEAVSKSVGGDDKARDAAEKEVENARAKVEELRKSLDSDDTRYTSLQASLKALEGPDETDEHRRQPYPALSTGRRAALARWITDPRNPLTARVAVNHIWMRHFGQPLVEPVTDFGRRTEQPAQHQLLDWLAVELIESGWSMKHLHRLIVTSRTYQLDSATAGADPETVQRDPENAFYWRRRPVRMESQAIRDSLLSLAGTLDRRLGGPTIDPKGEDTANRRSLYFTHSRDDRHAFLSMFDDADILACYRRSESVVPQQALALANSKLSMIMSRQLADRLAGPENPTDEDYVQRAFELILCRQPEAEEARACLEALEQMRRILTEAGHGEPRRRARQNLVHALLNHNDFITIR